MPAAAKQYSTPEVRLLVGVCRELQREAGDEPFFLATTTLERLLGLNRMRAWRWLDGLVRDGVLDVIERGDPRTRRASRFRYLGD